MARIGPKKLIVARRDRSPQSIWLSKNVKTSILKITYTCRQKIALPFRWTIWILLILILKSNFMISMWQLQISITIIHLSISSHRCQLANSLMLMISTFRNTSSSRQALITQSMGKGLMANFRYTLSQQYKRVQLSDPCLVSSFQRSWMPRLRRQ